MIEPLCPVGLMSEFPDIRVKGFDFREYNRRFIESNVIIDARAKEVYYPPHWCALSIKCSFNGKEYYQSNNSQYAVDDDNFLVFNEGKVYSSWIDSKEEVQSYTINIAPKFENDAIQSITGDSQFLIDNSAEERKGKVRFTEKLYPHDQLISPILARIRELAKDRVKNHEVLNELFFLLIQRMVHLQGQTSGHAHALQKLRPATRIELFERLTRAKDFIYSLYDKNITLEQAAGIACLNRFYFLRQFKEAFGVTPHQFLTKRRLTVAAWMLVKTDKPVAEICASVGFSDLASFSKLFRKVYSVPPSMYRMGELYKTSAQSQLSPSDEIDAPTTFSF